MGPAPPLPIHLPPETPSPPIFGPVSEQQDLKTEVAPPGPPLSEDDAAAAETLAPAVHGGRRSHRGEVGVDLYLRKVGLCGEGGAGEGRG